MWYNDIGVQSCSACSSEGREKKTIQDREVNQTNVPLGILHGRIRWDEGLKERRKGQGNRDTR